MTSSTHTTIGSRRSVLRTMAATLAMGTLTLAGMTGNAIAQANSNTMAQAFPNKPITIIVPFPAGGTTDILARIVGQNMSEQFGQTVVIDNRAGAGGNIGSQAVARAPADGYTLLMGTVGTHSINPHLYANMPFDPIKDFAPLSRVAMVPNLLVVNPSRPYRSVKELIAYAKANPGKVNFASSGNGTSIHLSGELFRQMAQLDMQHVPYRGSSPAVTDLVGGQVDIMFDNMPSAISHVRAGKLIPLAVTTSTRSPELPDVPTIAESGLPGYEATSWFGLFAPAQTPPDVIRTLHTAIDKALQDPAVIAQFTKQGAQANRETPESFAAFIKSENEKWSKVVKASGAAVN